MTTKHRRSPCAPLGAILMVIASAACTAVQSGATGSTGDGGAPAAGEPAPPGLTCLQVLQCVIDCPESAAACPDACVEKGTSGARALVVAFATCVDANKCTDAVCTEQKCGADLEACITSSKAETTGTSLVGAPPPGSVPSDLVGSWAGASSGATERLVFNADGTGNWQSAVSSSRPDCFSFTRTTRSGTMVVTDTTITVNANQVVSTVQNCKPPSLDTDEAPVVARISWSRKDENTIAIVDAACAEKYAGYAYSIGQYCTARLTRE